MKSNKITKIVIIAVIFFLGLLLGVMVVPKKTVQVEKIITQEPKIQGLIIKDIPIVGVDEKGNGVSGKLSIEVKPGSGLVLVNINDVLADYLTQLSARNAAKIGANYTGIDLSRLDVVYTIHANASVVEGPSAGAAMAVGTIAALENKNINPEVFITGAIDESGNVLPVGGIIEKAKVAKSSGAKLFLIPSADYIQNYERVKKCTKYNDLEYCTVTFEPKEGDISKTLGIEVKQVKNIKEAVDYFIK